MDGVREGGMFIVHIYALCSLGLLANIVLAPHAISIQSIIQGVGGSISWSPAFLVKLSDKDANFSLRLHYRIPFAIFLLVSHGIVLGLHLPSPVAQELLSRTCMLLLVDINGILLLSTRHSLFIELAAGLHPDYLLALTMVGSMAGIETFLLFGLTSVKKKAVGDIFASLSSWPPMVVSGRSNIVK